ncbi:GntR family transcriptional regulator [uncultured Enterobacter sp.]|uniref:GntR family transcriptional regulator n=1 Tax=uncultured Enterobacter sp. TaxID=238202 RepID=UPI00262DFB32|nr:GntR family transcriptional regulator [uncultured Enterobacter sp.]
MSQTLDVANKLRSMIINMDIGPGEKLTERWAESVLGASRTPVRAAFQQLESEELLRREGSRWFVAPIDVNELKQLYIYREVLEVAALKLTIESRKSAQTDKLSILLDLPMTCLTKHAQHDDAVDFHLRLAELCDNPFIINSLEKVLGQLARTRWLEASPDNPAWHEHKVIIDAIQSQEYEKAIVSLSMHLKGNCNRLIESITSQKRSLRASGILV